MSLNKLSLIKLKKNCQETLYQSIDEKLGLYNSQSYMPAFTSSVEIQNNEYSKKLFVFKSKNILLNFDNVYKFKDFPIDELLQGKINANLIHREIYTKSNNYDSYKNYIINKDIFIKSNPILDVIKYMEGKYKTDLEIPSIFSYRTNQKINNINNNAYIEAICSYYLNLLNEQKLTSLFPEFYGSFNGISKKYLHDISEDYEFIKDKDWFIENNKKKIFEIFKNDNLEEFEKFSFKNMEKINYEKESKIDKNINDVIVDEIDIELDSIILHKIDYSEEENEEVIEENEEENEEDIEENEEENEEDIEENEEEIVEDIEENEEENEEDIKENEEEIVEDIEFVEEYNSESDSDSEISLSSLMSNQSCIISETYAKLSSMPVQILAMELMDETLTELIKNDLKKEEWKSILFQICFGLAVAQKHFKFIHNDLHTDNIMFKKIEEEYKYFKYKDKYFKVPTYKKETKVIDFARGILNVGKKKYFSDVFKKDGDAGGQYNYANTFCCYKKKKDYNLNFDLARLGTTIINYLNDYELSSFVNSWTIGSHGKDFMHMDDDFSLYVEISKYATDCLPKNQLERNFFKEYIINKEDIPDNVHIYDY